jgi:hypothetical protein
MNPLEVTEKLLKDFRENNSGQLGEIQKSGKGLLASCAKVKLSWSGSFAGWHGRMYYRNFVIPPFNDRFSVEWGGLLDGLPDGWVEKQNEEILPKIEELTGNGFTYSGFENRIKSLRDQAEALKREISINFSVFSFDSNSQKEKDLLSQIESYQFGKTKEAFIKNEMPSNFVTRDSDALMQGICLPSWLYYKGAALESASLCDSINEFIMMADRLIRQLEIKRSILSTKTSIPTRKPGNDSFINKKPGILFYVFLFGLLICVGFLLFDVFISKKELGVTEILGVSIFLGGSLISFLKR